MVLLIDKCEKCGNIVKAILPDLFPNLNAKKLEEFKRICEKPKSEFCEKCNIGKER